MLATCNYKEYNIENELHLDAYSISFDKGKSENWQGKSYPSLAPNRQFWKIWKDNIGYRSEEINNLFYAEQYYFQVLRNLNPEEILEDLDNSVMLCYESSEQFCHRGLAAAWLELLLDIEIPEIKFVDGKVIKTVRNPYYKETMESVIRKFEYMDEFETIHEYYLSTKQKQKILTK